MENVNAKMDEQLKARVDDLTRANDENRDGKLDAADLKAQLNRIEAQLELQDRQNRGIIANQRKRMILSVVLVVVILAALAFFGWRMNIAYNNVMDACSRVNDLADTVNTSLATLDQSELDADDAGPSGNHRPVEKNRRGRAEQRPDPAARPDGHREQSAIPGAEHREFVQRVKFRVWTVNKM